MDNGHTYWKIIRLAQRNRNHGPSGLHALHDRPHLVCADCSLSHDESISPMEFCFCRARTLRSHRFCGRPADAGGNGDFWPSFIGAFSRTAVFVERHFACHNMGLHLPSASARAQSAPKGLESRNSEPSCIDELD